MLRPATPLTVLLLAAFVLLLISVLSVPIVKSIPLAQFDGVNFGVFGYCKGDTCSNFEVGYDPSVVVGADNNGDFTLPVGTRTTLSSILIFHPIAAFFTLIMLILAGLSHMHSPSHSPRYLLGVFILSILTLILSLLSFLIDVLLFVPHMAWGSYIVLAATILIAASGIVSCAMRRTLVSRKARKRRIAENAEMNGENFYARQAAEPVTPIVAPVVSAGPGGDKLPSFATFEVQKDGANGPAGTGDEERIPLTSRSPSERSRDATPVNANASPGTDEGYGGPPPLVPGGPNSRGYNGGPPPRDQYGNVIPPPQQGYSGMRGGPRNQYGPPGGYRGRGGPPGGYRGRGGPPGYGRGGYAPNAGPGPYGPGPYGPGLNRGGMDNGMGPMGAGGMMRGGRGLPPGHLNGYGRGGYSSRDPSPGGYEGYDQSQSSLHSEPNYPRSGSAPLPEDNYVRYGQGGRPESLARAESPPPLAGIDDGAPVGQALEMDSTNDSRSSSAPPQGFTNQYGPLRDSDGDVAGMVGLQQQRQDVPHNSDGSKYSNEEYIPPRQAWNQGRFSPLNPATQPAELAQTGNGHRRQGSGDNYYEDVDPRFAGPTAPAELQASNVPSALIPGYSAHPIPEQRNQSLRVQPQNGNAGPSPGLDASNSYEDLHSGSRSPAESDRSNFTSVSQRGINPRWNPGMGGPNPMPLPGGRRPMPPPQRNDILLNSNPDFELPGARSRGGPPGRGGRFAPPGPPPPGGMVPRSAYDQAGNAM